MYHRGKHKCLSISIIKCGVELLEYGQDVNVIINMMDVFAGNFDAEKFSEVFNVNAIVTNRNKTGITSKEVLTTRTNNFKINYGTEVESVITELENLVRNDIKYNHRFIAIQFLKGNDDALKLYRNADTALMLREKLSENLVELGIAKSLNGMFFIKRKEFFDQVMGEFYKREASKSELKWLNEKFDKVALHKVWGYFIFAFIMYLVFVITYQGGVLQDVVDQIIGTFNSIVGDVLTNVGVNSHIVDFIVDGALAGVAGVLVFIPQILIMFTLLTILESIGYFSRVTVLFEHLFDKLGLSSHSMIPYISGLGCNVIGIMSTRTIKDEKKKTDFM